MSLKYIIIFLILLSGCATNIKRTTESKDRGSLKESGFFEGAMDLQQPSMDLKVSGNATVLIGDKAIQTKVKSETKKSIKTDSAWDMTFSEAYQKYSTLTVVFFGIGILLIVFAIKRFEKTSVGRVFGTALNQVDTMLKQYDPKGDEYRVAQNIKDQLEQRKENFFKRG